MPSLFTKLTSGSSSKRTNPYSNPHHPSHVPIPGKPLRSASPDIPSRDLLAEARLSANRDPITGKLFSQPVMPASNSSRAQVNPTASSNSNAREEPSAYAFRANQTPQTMGSRYDLFSSEERKRMEREEKIRIARGGQEFYAPERRVEEFYAEGVRDW